MAGVIWEYDGNKFTNLKSEITHLFSDRKAIPGIGLQYYPFCELISEEWVINRHFFFDKMMDTTSVNLKTVLSYNKKMCVQDWIDNYHKYDKYVLDIIQPILEKYKVKEVEFCGLHEYNVAYLRVEIIKNFPIWTMINKRSI